MGLSSYLLWLSRAFARRSLSMTLRIARAEITGSAGDRPSGGGTGVDSLYFMQKGHSVKLVDISDVGLQNATEEAQGAGVEDKLEIYQVDLADSSIPLGDDSVDVIYSKLAIHYFTKEKTQAVLQELHRILKQGGKAYLTARNSITRGRSRISFFERNRNRNRGFSL